MPAVPAAWNPLGSGNNLKKRRAFSALLDKIYMP